MNVMEMQKDGVNYFVEYTDKISMFDKVPELIGISEPDQVLPVDLSELDINSVKTPFPKRSGRRDRVLGGVDFVDVKNPLQDLREDFFDALGKVLAKMADSISNEIKEAEHQPQGWEIECSLTMMAGGGICVLTGETNAGIKVKMFWNQENAKT